MTSKPIKIISEKEAEDVDAVVCARVGPSPWPDNVQTTGRPPRHRSMKSKSDASGSFPRVRMRVASDRRIRLGIYAISMLYIIGPCGHCVDS